MLALAAAVLAGCGEARYAHQTIIPPTPVVIPSSTPSPFPSPEIIPSVTPFPTSASIPPACPGPQLALPYNDIRSASSGRTILLAEWGRGNISDFAFDGDGNELWLLSSNGLSQLDPESQVESHQMLLNPLGRRLLLAPKSPIAAVVGYWNDPQQIRFRNTSSGESVPGLALSGTVLDAAYSPDGAWLAVSQGCSVFIWQVVGGVPVAEKPALTLNAAGDWINHLAFSTDGQFLAAASLSGEIALWNIETGENVFLIQAHGGLINDLAFSPDGKYLISVADDKNARLWNLDTGKEIRSALEHDTPVTAVAFSPAGDMLATATSEGMLRLWRMNDGFVLFDRSLDSIFTWVNRISFSPDGRLLIASAADGSLRFWKTDSDSLALSTSPLVMFNKGKSEINGFDLSSDGRLLVAAEGDTNLTLYRFADGFPYQTIRAPGTGSTVGVAFSNDDDKVASGTEDEFVRLWNVVWSGETPSLEPEHELDGVSPVTGVIYRPGTEMFAAGARDRTVRIWMEKKGTLINTITNEAAVNSIAFSPDGMTLAAGCANGITEVWTIEGANIFRRYSLRGHTNGVESVVFSPDGKWIATGSLDRQVRIWRANDGGLMYTLTGHMGWIFGLAFSPDSSILASGADDSIIHLWDTLSGEWIGTLRGQASEVHALHFTPDGKLLISAARDGTIRIWGGLPPKIN